MVPNRPACAWHAHVWCGERGSSRQCTSQSSSFAAYAGFSRGLAAQWRCCTIELTAMGKSSASLGKANARSIADMQFPRRAIRVCGVQRVKLSARAARMGQLLSSGLRASAERHTFVNPAFHGPFHMPRWLLEVDFFSLSSRRLSTALCNALVDHMCRSDQWFTARTSTRSPPVLGSGHRLQGPKVAFPL